MIGKTAQADERCRIRHHQLGIAQSDKGDEHPNAAGGGILQAFWNSVDDLLPHARNGKNQKEDAGKKDNAEGGAPRNVHAQADHVSEVGVERHARRQRDGIVRVQSHHQRGSGRRYAGGKHDAFDRHARLRQNLRIHHDDVRHRDERGQSAEKFAAHRGLIFGKTEVAFDQFGSWWCRWSRVNETDILRHCSWLPGTTEIHVADSRFGCPAGSPVARARPLNILRGRTCIDLAGGRSFRREPAILRCESHVNSPACRNSGNSHAHTAMTTSVPTPPRHHRRHSAKPLRRHARFELPKLVGSSNENHVHGGHASAHFIRRGQLRERGADDHADHVARSQQQQRDQRDRQAARDAEDNREDSEAGNRPQQRQARTVRATAGAPATPP